MAKLRVGVIGCSGIGTTHASGLIGLDNVELAAGCDFVQDTLDAFKAQYQDKWDGISLYTNHKEMLAQEDLDVVTVATSDHRHADLVVDASNAGVKGIFCEKPMATTVEDAKRMLDASEKNGTYLSIDHTRRWQPLWRHTKDEVVDGGQIGDVRYVIGTLSGGRAMLFRNGTHCVDAICYYADSDPVWVSAELEEGYEDYTEYKGDGGHDPATEPSAHGYIHFANGVRGYYAGGPKNTPSGFRAEIVGTDGYVLINDQVATIHKGDSVEKIEAPSWGVTGIPAGVQETIKLVAEGGTPVSPASAGYNVVQIIIGFLTSQQQDNGKVKLPL
ncbi:Gfo/Idh/MocA family oxidoreductase [Candidatus Poribacteria bacterium]|nr:Gfo/Idh/MocA family oxidoreductase [Candidatus Poribacteria bacterium]